MRRSARRAAPRDWRGRHLGKRARLRQRVRSRGGGGVAGFALLRCAGACRSESAWVYAATLSVRAECVLEPGCCTVAPSYFAKMPLCACAAVCRGVGGRRVACAALHWMLHPKPKLLC